MLLKKRWCLETGAGGGDAPEKKVSYHMILERPGFALIAIFFKFSAMHTHLLGGS